MSDILLSIKDLKRDFQSGDKTLHILRGVDLELKKGEVVALVGASGSGKSTLLQIAGLLDRPTAGAVAINGANINFSDDKTRTKLRSESLGFVYQAHHLMSDFTALENVMMPLLIAGWSKSKAQVRAEELLNGLHLGERLEHAPSKLSGGEQQRVAIARAIANNPLVLLADEPTGNLDEATSARVMEQLILTVRKSGLAAIVATHDMQLASNMDRIVRLKDGVIQ